MSKRTWIFILVILPFLVGGALYLRTLARRLFFEPAGKPEAALRTQLNQEVLQSASTSTQNVTLYFPSYSQGKLVAEARTLALAPEVLDRVRQIILALVEGSHQGSDLALPASANLRAVFLTEDGTVYLDFSSDIVNNFPVGIESETLSIYSVVMSLTANLPEVKRVKFLEQGQEVDTLAGHADLSGVFAPDPSRIASAQSN